MLGAAVFSYMSVFGKGRPPSHPDCVDMLKVIEELIRGGADVNVNTMVSESTQSTVCMKYAKYRMHEHNVRAHDE